MLADNAEEIEEGLMTRILIFEGRAGNTDFLLSVINL